MSEQNISDLIANITSLAQSLASVTAEKAAREKRYKHQISILLQELKKRHEADELNNATSQRFNE